MKFNHTECNPPEEAIVLEKGTYPFKVLKAEEKTSQSGNPMIELFVRLNPELYPYGKANVYLTDTEKSGYMRKSFVESIGKPNLWENQEIHASDLFGAKGLCVVSKEVCKNKEGLETYDESGKKMFRNKIVKFLLPKNEKQLSLDMQAPADAALNDDIPF